MATTPLSYLNQYFTTFLNVGGGIDNSQTTGIVAQSVSGVDITKPGVACISYSNPIDTSVAEWFKYTSINGSNEFQGVTRGGEGFSAKSHSNQAVIAFPLSESHINDINAMFDSTGIDTAQISTPASPSAGRNKLYFKSDDLPYTLTSGGTEAALATQSYVTANAGGSVNLNQQAIINGNFDVWQRGTTATNQTSGAFIADRWMSYKAAGSGGALPTNVVESRQAITPGELSNSFYFFRVAPDGAGTTAADQLWQRYQLIEHGTRFLCGLNKTVTVSFYARSSITNKKLGVYLEQNYGTTGSPSATETLVGDAFTLTSSWTKYTLTVTTNTLVGKTFGTDNNDSLSVTFAYAYGTTFDGRVGESTAETFVGSGNIDIAQVQLNAGSTALTFQPKSFAQELADCQRYCYREVASSTAHSYCISNVIFTTTAAVVCFALPVPMRTSPTVTYLNIVADDSGVAARAISAVSVSSYSPSKPVLTFTIAASTANKAHSINANGTTSSYIDFNAEL